MKSEENLFNNFKETFLDGNDELVNIPDFIKLIQQDAFAAGRDAGEAKGRDDILDKVDDLINKLLINKLFKDIGPYRPFTSDLQWLQRNILALRTTKLTTNEKGE